MLQTKSSLEADAGFHGIWPPICPVTRAKIIFSHYYSLDNISKISNYTLKEEMHMKKLLLIIMVTLFVSVNITALTWGGVDPVKWIGQFGDCSPN